MADDTLTAVDVKHGTVRWARRIADATPERLRRGVVRRDGRVLAASGTRLQAFDEKDGVEVQLPALAAEVVDLAVLSDGRALVVQKHAFSSGKPSMRLRIVYPASTLAVDVDIPNCADRIAIMRDGKRAFIAPTHCRDARPLDPISVIDLTPGREQFVRNLPGFGPVTLARSSSRAVAFVDALLADPTLFDDPTQRPNPDRVGSRYFLMLLDPETLRFDLREFGDRLPRFTITPNGETILVDSVDDGRIWTTDVGDSGVPLRTFDVRSRTYADLDGPSMMLDAFVMTSDSRHLFALQDGLLDLEVEARKVSNVALGFVPSTLNLSSDDRFLYLRDRDRVCAFSLAQHECTRFLGSTR
jgi:hypothetical protein